MIEVILEEALKQADSRNSEVVGKILRLLLQGDYSDHETKCEHCFWHIQRAKLSSQIRILEASLDVADGDLDSMRFRFVAVADEVDDLRRRLSYIDTHHLKCNEECCFDPKPEETGYRICHRQI